MTNEIREPIQERSIEKKNKIIEYGFKLICEKGYYNTNTAEIAKASGVSTGIVYQYFKDKHDILLEGIKLYADSVLYPSLSLKSSKIENGDTHQFFSSIVKQFIKKHKSYKNAHEWLNEVSHSDKEIAQAINEMEIKLSNNFAEALAQNGFSQKNLKEKVHIAIHLIEDLCHEIVFHKHVDIDYDAMTEETIDAICYLINK